MEAQLNYVICHNVFDTWRRLFLVSCALVLLFAAGAKLAAKHSEKELSLHDPVVPFVTSGELMACSSAFEIILGVVILLRMSDAPIQTLLTVMWVSLVFAAYHLAFLTSPQRAGVAFCQCFGGAGGIIGKYSDSLAWFLIVYMAGVGLCFLIATKLLSTCRSRKVLAGLRQGFLNPTVPH